METDNKKIDVIVHACEDKIAKDIKILDLTKKNTICDYFIIATGNSTTQTQAIADNVKNEAEKYGYEYRGTEGYHPGNWILCDLDDIIVHIFLPEDRKYYDLERLWE